MSDLWAGDRRALPPPPRSGHQRARARAPGNKKSASVYLINKCRIKLDSGFETCSKLRQKTNAPTNENLSLIKLILVTIVRKNITEISLTVFDLSRPNTAGKKES